MIRPQSIATVFVDRDGVLNRKPPRYILSPERLSLLPGAAEAVSLLNAAHKTVYVVTNQRCVALGLLTPHTLDQIHAVLRQQLADAAGARLGGIYSCPHDDAECICRKPLPGLLQQAQREHPDIDFATSVFVGDSAVDIRAGQAVGCHTVLIGRGRRRAEELASLERECRSPTATAISLLDATQRFLLDL